jgi:hypothetical protein
MVAICSDDRPFPVYASLLQAAYLGHVFLLAYPPGDWDAKAAIAVQFQI